jgi:hypothetical protein
MKTTELQKLIDWDVIMPLPRYAGGHDDQMKALFKGAKVMAHWNEGDYQGVVATAVQLADGRYCWYQDGYGSCSGCDSWEDADDATVKGLCISLAIDAEVFNTLEEMLDDMKGIRAESWKTTAGQELSTIIENELKNKKKSLTYEIQQKYIDEASKEYDSRLEKLKYASKELGIGFHEYDSESMAHCIFDIAKEKWIKDGYVDDSPTIFSKVSEREERLLTQIIGKDVNNHFDNRFIKTI